MNRPRLVRFDRYFDYLTDDAAERLMQRDAARLRKAALVGFERRTPARELRDPAQHRQMTRMMREHRCATSHGGFARGGGPPAPSTARCRGSRASSPARKPTGSSPAAAASSSTKLSTKNV